MTAFSERVCGEMLEGVGELYQCDNLERFPSVALTVVGGLVGADSSIFNYVAPALPRVKAVPSVTIPEFEQLTGRFARHLPEHPVLKHYLLTGDPGAFKISDFQSEREFRRSALYRHIYREFGCEDQMTVTLFSPGAELIAISLHRDRRSFTERDRRILNLLRPHLAGAYRQVERAGLWNRAGAGWPDDSGFARVTTIRLDQKGRSVHFGPRAEQWLRNFFPEELNRTSRLPALVNAWLRRARGGFRDCLVRERDGHRLRMALFDDEPEGGQVLVLGLEMLSALARRQCAGVLTAREVEVLLEVEQGRTNDEISAALGISPFTVRHHLEHIFEKLQVHSRTAAVTKLRQMCSCES